MIVSQRTVDGRVVSCEYADLTANQYWFEVEGKVVDGPRALTVDEWRRFGPQPLEGVPLMAALNAALGVWSLADAASVAGVSEQALVDEVTAWVVASADL